PNVFDFEGIVPYACVLFALALVLAIGLIMRRAATAAAIGLIGYFGLRIGLQTWARKDYVGALHRVWPVGTSGPANLDRAWNLASGPSDAAGQVLPQTGASQCLHPCR